MTERIEGLELETAEITVRLGVSALELLRSRWIACTRVWLTQQPDGTYALGLVTPTPPGEGGVPPARAVETDDRDFRFPDWDGGFDAP